MNLLKEVFFLCSRLSSRRLVGGFISRMAVVFAGSTVIPSFVITNPNNFPVTTPRKHDRGFILMLCFRSISKTLRRSAR